MGKVTATMIVVSIITGASSASAVVFGGTNFGFGGYPDHQCSQPFGKPIKPFRFTDQYEVDAYNREVCRYNRDLDYYLDCVRTYIDNADNDVQRIREKVDDAISEANSL